MVNVSWHQSFDTDALYFFGLSSAPGTSFVIVPESGADALSISGMLAVVGLVRWRKSRA